MSKTTQLSPRRKVDTVVRQFLPVVSELASGIPEVHLEAFAAPLPAKCLAVCARRRLPSQRLQFDWN
jgi:hypothetical protein